MEILKKIFISTKPRPTATAEKKYFNSLDAEVPALLDFIALNEEEGKFFSLLDVGAFGSGASYAPALRKYFPGAAYDGVDLKLDPETTALLDTYYIGDITTRNFASYDVTICVSALGRYAPTEQLKVFRRACELAKTCVFFSFPYGAEESMFGERTNVTAQQLAAFTQVCGGAVEKKFFYNEFPKDSAKWRRISQARASKVRLLPGREVQCIGMLQVRKPTKPLKGEFRGITAYLMKKTRLLKAQPEYMEGRENYTMFNTGGVELEVGEFLYAFVKMTKPLRILETGTHLGISAMYMGQALKENDEGGKIVTLEIFDENIKKSETMWRQTRVQESVIALKARSLEFETNEIFDMLFLDSEPDIRFDELMRFYPSLKPGGFILVHDLHVNLGRSDASVNGMKNWPFGDFREKFGHLIMDHSLQTFVFRTPRGLVVFQKSAVDFSHTNFLRQNTSGEVQNEP